MRLKFALMLAVLGKFFNRSVVPNLFQVGGLAAFASGCFVLAPFFGLMVTGVFLAFIGWAIDKGGS